MEEKRVVIVGGGVAGTTLAAGLLKRKARTELVVIEQKEYFEVPFAQLRGLTDPEGFGRKIRKPLAALLPGAEIVRARAVGLADGEVKLEDGRGVTYDWLVLATGSRFGQWPFLKGVQPTVADREANGKTYAAELVIPAVGIDRNTAWIGGGLGGAINSAGAVAVEPDLRVKGLTNVFALGDINDVPEIKMGALAARQAKLTARNLLTALKNPPASLKPYGPSGPLGLVTIGTQKGAVQLPFGHAHFLIAVKQKDLFASMYLK